MERKNPFPFSLDLENFAYSELCLWRVLLRNSHIFHPYKSIESTANCVYWLFFFFSSVCWALISGHMQCKCWCRRRHRCSARQFERRRFVCTWINFVEIFMFCVLRFRPDSLLCWSVVASIVVGAAAIAGWKGAAGNKEKERQSETERERKRVRLRILPFSPLRYLDWINKIARTHTLTR